VGLGEVSNNDRPFLAEVQERLLSFAQMALEDDILAALTREPGSKGREIASRLGLDKSLVNSTLFKLRLRKLAWQDSGYRWFLKSASPESRQTVQPQLDTPLSRLCRYYLQCLSLDDEGDVSLFAQSQHSPQYVKLPVFPDLDPEERPIKSFDGVTELFRRLRNSDRRLVPYVGYPVRLRHVRAQTGWEGFKVEPVFLFEFQENALQSDSESFLTGELPTFNFRVLKSFALGDDSHVMDEAGRLAEDLGFSEADPPELEDYIARLVEIRDDWDWKEEMNPQQLSSGTPLAQVNDVGIYNRAIVFGCERSQFTKGLEQELAKLREVTEEKYHTTALGAWLRRDFTSFRAPNVQESELLEPLPLNSEQREAIEKGLTLPLTIITGPPGTGKSQVVSTLLVNAAKRGLRVLFASKNNKAVDVVETRVNALGSRPILLRLGRAEYQANLSQYLTTLLASRATPEDEENFREAQSEYAALTVKIRALQDRAQEIVELRNTVDAAERKAEAVRSELGEDRFNQFWSFDANGLQQQAESLLAAAEHACREKQPIVTRLFWFAFRNARIAALCRVTEDVRKSLQSVGISVPTNPTADTHVAAWIEASGELRRRSEQVRLASAYWKQLNLLSAGERLEDLTSELVGLKNDCASKSMRVWEAWLRLAPARLNQSDRKNLGDFNAVLRLLVQSDGQGQRAGRDVFARYYCLFPHFVSQLPCWAVISLSARGRIPLEAGFFDLLVVDEASQCDIASLLPLLFRAKAAVIIGDPMQLRHISAISPRRDRDLLQQHGLAETHINWAFSENSVFDLASPLASGDDIIMLRDHHRSHADIIGFSNDHFYGGRLRVATNYDRLKRFNFDGPALRWTHIQGQAVRRNSSWLNEAEASVVVKEVERIILQQGYQGSVGVVTPFREQVNRIRDLLHAHPQAALLLRNGELLVDTVYRFQGDERDMMIFSPVVSDGISNGAIGWLKKTTNQFNVAITRARAVLVVVGDFAAAKNSDIKHLSAFAGYIESLNTNTRHVAEHENYDVGSNYPKVTHPELVSDWERLFYAKLYQAGLRPIPQYDVEKFILDFALINCNRRLDIEVDGERYHRDWTGELLRRDQLRNMRLIELGWDVMRFWVYELRDDMPRCLERVKRWSHG
jgi:superfamily I DNA and/or RNA helicase/very-short-patch-repair endonuclease